ncbi:hypothetical protein Trydic_g18020 [Trypoxylus dichotomus]
MRPILLELGCQGLRPKAILLTFSAGVVVVVDAIFLNEHLYDSESATRPRLSPIRKCFFPTAKSSPTPSTHR